MCIVVYLVVNYTYTYCIKLAQKFEIDCIGFIGEILRGKEKIGRKEELSVFHHQPIRSFCAIQQL